MLINVASADELFSLRMKKDWSEKQFKVNFVHIKLL